MEIIKHGTPPDEKEYKITCFCDSVLLVKKKDAVGYRGFHQKLIFECPVCKVHFEIEGIYRYK